MSFASDIAKFNKKTLDRFIKVKKASALGLLGAIVIETPVLFGVLRNNWNLEFGSPSDNITDQGNINAGAIIGEMQNKLEGGVDATNTIYFTNSLSYAPPIEYDSYSAQAPNGMVRVNVARWQTIVQAANRTVP